MQAVSVTVGVLAAGVFIIRALPFWGVSTRAPDFDNPQVVPGRGGFVTALRGLERRISVIS